MANDLLTVSEAAQLLGMSSDNVRYLERHGKLHATRIGNQRIFFLRDVERFKLQREAEVSAKDAAEVLHAEKQ
jgi:excisionase family DNA binding protein